MPKGLTDEQNANVRPFLVELVAQGSQQQAGDAIGLSQAAVSRVVKGTGGMSWPSAERLAAVLRLDPAAMLRGERVPLRSVRDLPGYDDARAGLIGTYNEPMLDAATRALDAVQCAEISLATLEDAANFAQRHRPRLPRIEVKPTGVAARLQGEVARVTVEANEPARKKAKGER